MIKVSTAVNEYDAIICNNDDDDDHMSVCVCVGNFDRRLETLREGSKRVCVL